MRLLKETKVKIEALKNSLMEHPSFSNYAFKAILNGTLEIQSKEKILEAIKRKALASKEGTNWLSEDRMGWEKETTIKFNREDIIIAPSDYEKEIKKVKEYNSIIQESIRTLKEQLNTIELRIQLSSDNALKTLINEVSDMGDISLIDTKIKLLN